MTLEKGWEEKNIPLFIHGDGVEYTAHNDNLLVFSWGCLLGNLPTLQNHWLLATSPTSCTSSNRWDPIWKYLKWSLTALAAGTHPTTDPDGKPLEKGSTFFKFKGKPLHPNHYKATLWSIIGDHDFFPTPSSYPTGVLTSHAGSVTLKIFQELPLEKGTRRYAWKSKNFRCTAMKNAWQTHGLTILCFNFHG